MLTANDEDIPLFSWRVHLARDRRRMSLAGFILLTGLSVGVGILYESPVYGILAAGVLFGSTATYWLPRRYVVYTDRLEVRPLGMNRPLVYPWSRFRACLADRTTLFLSPTSQAAGLARLRGLTIYLPLDNAAVREFIVQRITSQSA